MEDQIWARSRLVQLYKAFGPPILMDTFWRLSNMGRKMRTPQFKALLELLIEDMPVDPLEEEDVNVLKANPDDIEPYKPYKMVPLQESAPAS
ncbi:hypothetical protein DFH06DRAFT_1344003 [Mycena polygramma]|nr:hypothetical protein DFH06DRAFT_1344003 [Mycena polygramma]